MAGIAKCPIFNWDISYNELHPFPYSESHTEFRVSREELQRARQATKTTRDKWMEVFQNIGKANPITMFRIVSVHISAGLKCLRQGHFLSDGH